MAKKRRRADEDRDADADYEAWIRKCEKDLATTRQTLRALIALRDAPDGAAALGAGVGKRLADFGLIVRESDGRWRAAVEDEIIGLNIALIRRIFSLIGAAE